MKKFEILLLTIVCLTAALTLVSAAETGSPATPGAPAAAPSAAPATAPIAENSKPETMIQKAENALEKTEVKIMDAAEKVMEKTEEIMEGKKPEAVKTEGETKLGEPVETEEKADEAEEKAEMDSEEEADETEEKAEMDSEEEADEAEEKAEMNSDEKADEESDEEDEEDEEEKSAEEDAKSEPSDDEEITITEETMEVPETMTDDAFLRACFLHWFCHLNQHAHCWGPNCFFGHSDASSPIRRENPIEEILPNYCIGVLTSPIPEPLAVHFDLRPGTGLWVEHVIPGSPAAEAGIHRGDILLQATVHSEENGEKTKKVFWLNHPILLMDLVEQIGPDEFELTSICSGKEQKTSLKPIERKELMEKAGILK